MLKIGSAVHTAHGPGTITDADTVRGRTQFKVSGTGFDVWLDETKIAASQASEMDEEAGHRYLKWERQYDDEGKGDPYVAPEDRAKSVDELLMDDEDEPKEEDEWVPPWEKDAALGNVDESNSTTLPYDYTPQNPVEMFSQEQTMSPDHEVDLEERMTPTNSVTGESGSLDTPGPSRDLFAGKGDWRRNQPYDEAGTDYEPAPKKRPVRTKSEADWAKEENDHIEDMAEEFRRGRAGSTSWMSGISKDELADLIGYPGEEDDEQLRNYDELFGQEHKHSSTHTAAPGSFRHYMQWAQQAGMQPGQAEAADLYGSTHGLDQEGVGKLLEHFNNQSQRTSSRITAGGWGDVDVAGGESGGSSAPGSFDHYLEYSHRNGMHPGDSMTADRYSREHGVSLERSGDYARQSGNGRERGEGLRPAPTGYQMHPNGHSFSASRFAGNDSGLSDEDLAAFYEGDDDYRDGVRAMQAKPLPEGLDERLPGESRRESSYRPAGLSDKYIDIQAAVDPTDPVTQFRNDPVTFIERTAYLHESSTGLDPRVGQYMDLVEADPMIREAAWRDVRQKAMRLRREGRVHVKDVAPDRIYATVEGDNGVYDVMIAKGASMGPYGGGHDIANWRCGCEWGKWAFKRTRTFIGRLCSHGYASYMELNSQHFKGQPRQQRLPRPPKRRKQSSIHEAFDYQDPNTGEITTYPDDSWQAQALVPASESYFGKSPEEIAAIDAVRNKKWEQWKAENGIYNARDALEYIKNNQGRRHEPSQAWTCRCDKCKPQVEARERHLREHGRIAGVVDDYKTWAEDNNGGTVDLPSVDAYISELEDPLDPEEVKAIYDYAHENMTERPERVYDVDGYTLDPDDVYDGGNGLDNSVLRSQSKPNRLSPDLYAVPEGEGQHFTDLGDDRKTTGPDQIQARRIRGGWNQADSIENWAHALTSYAEKRGMSPEEAFPQFQDIVGGPWDDQAELLLEHVRQHGGHREAKVEKNWAKKHSELDDDHDPIVRFSMRKEALTYTADEGLLTRLREISATPPSDSHGNMAERNHEISELVSELRDRGYDASLFVAMRREAVGAGGTYDVNSINDEEKKGDGTLPTPAPGQWGRNPNTPSTPGGPDPALTEAKPAGQAQTVRQTQPASGGGGGGGGGSNWSENTNTDPIGPGEYTIQSGDTYSNLAERAGWGDDYQGFANATGYQADNPDMIFAGDTMDVKAPPGASDQPAAPASEPAAPAPEPGAAAPMSGAPSADPVGGAAPDPGVGGGLGFLAPPPANPAAPNGQIVSRRFYADEDENLGSQLEPFYDFTESATAGAALGVGYTPEGEAVDSDTPAPQSPQTPAATPAASPSNGTTPAPAASPAAPKEPVQEPSDGSKKVLEDQQPQGVNTADPMAGFNSVMPILEGVGGAVMPLVTNTLGPIATGIGNAIGNGLSGLFSTAGVVQDGDDIALADDDYDGSTIVDPAFAGSGPSRKDWFGTSEDYLADHDYLDLNDEPEGDLISYRKQQPKQAASEKGPTYGRGADLDAMGYGDLEDGEPGSWGPNAPGRRGFPKDEDEDSNDIVAAFQRNAANSALAGSGGGGGYSDDAIAQAAQGFLRTAGRVYSLAEQQELMDEEHPKGARNLPGLDLRGTHYLEG